MSFADETDPDSKRFTEVLATNLPRHLQHALRRPESNVQTRPLYTRYCENLDHNADLVLRRVSEQWGLKEQLGIFVEIEFRPNFEKDLVKFQIGHHASRLELGVLVVAADRRSPHRAGRDRPDPPPATVRAASRTLEGAIEIPIRYSATEFTLVQGGQAMRAVRVE